MGVASRVVMPTIGDSERGVIRGDIGCIAGSSHVVHAMTSLTNSRTPGAMSATLKRLRLVAVPRNIGRSQASLMGSDACGQAIV